MNEFGPLFRGTVQASALRYSFEQAGLTLDNQPIPWNADAVVVQATLKLPSHVSRQASDFCLRIAVGERSIAVENLGPAERGDAWQITFRLPVPRESTQAELFFKHRSLGQLTLPVVSRLEFCKRLRIDMATLAVKLSEHVVSSQTFVGAQCRGLVASAVVNSPTSLLPIADLSFTVEARSQKTGTVHRVPVRLASSQLNSKQALVSVALPKPRTTGPWTLSWKLAEREVSSQTFRAISKRQFHRSLRLVESRFLIQDADGEVRTAAQLPPLKEVARVGPCFTLISGETGMAGTCKLQVRALVKGAVQPPLLVEEEVLVTDGPFVFAPGTADVSEVNQVEGFELRAANVVMGRLSLVPVPTGRFTSEGSITEVPDFTWSAAAEGQLNQRMRKLMGG